MPVNLTLNQLADHLRIERDVANEEPTRTVLVELLQSAAEWIDDYAAAPTNTANLAAARFCSYIFDTPPASKGAAWAIAHTNSGATALLNRWRNASGGMVSPSGGSVVAVAGGGVAPEREPEPEPMPFHYILFMRHSRQTDFEQSAIDNAPRVEGFAGGVVPPFAVIYPPPIRMPTSTRLAFAVPMGYGPPSSFSLDEIAYPDRSFTRTSTPIWTITATAEQVEGYYIDGARGISSLVGDTFALNGYS